MWRSSRLRGQSLRPDGRFIGRFIRIPKGIWMRKNKLLVTAAVLAGLYLMSIAVMSVIFLGPSRALVILSRPLAVLTLVPIIWLITR